MDQVVRPGMLGSAIFTLSLSAIWIERGSDAAPPSPTQAIGKAAKASELPRAVSLENLDDAMIRITDAMEKSALVRGKITGRIKSVEPRLLLSPTNLGPSDEQSALWMSIVSKAMEASPRYGSSDIKLQSSVAVLPKSKIVRLRIDSPRPIASKRTEGTPLIIYGWVCPDRRTALAL